MTSPAKSPFEFDSYRIDSHLVLNALNHLGMELYTELGREVPAVALLADYIIAEHGAGHGMDTRRIQLAVADEWNVCKTMLALKAALVGVQLEFREGGDFTATSVTDHGLAVLLRDVFAAWPNLAGHDVRLTLLGLGDRALRLSANLKLTPDTGLRQPFLRSLLNSSAGAVSMDIGTLDVTLDNGYAWELDIRPPLGI